MFKSNFSKYDLDNKVNVLVKNYEIEIKKAQVGDIREFNYPIRFRDHIEAQAVYAELRWPEVYGLEGRASNQFKVEEHLTWARFHSLIPRNFAQVKGEMLGMGTLFRIIQRGGNRVGPRRGILFSEELGINPTLAASYAIDYSDPNLLNLLEGLGPKLMLDFDCPVGYFDRTSLSLSHVKEEKMGKVIDDLRAKKQRLLETEAARLK